MNTCIITGASRGIGRAIAIKLSQRKDIRHFILLSRDDRGLAETKRMMNQSKHIEIYNVDLTKEEQVQKCVNTIGKRFDTLDILINVAGYAEPKPLLETTMDNWDTTYRVNVHAVFILTREVVKYMKQTGGTILNIASTAGMSSRPGWLAYSSSKAALISMSQTLSDELAEYGIKVYCASPGRCATKLRRTLAPDEDPATIMQPEHVADVVNYLISDEGMCLDGQNIVIRQQPQHQTKNTIKTADDRVTS